MEDRFLDWFQRQNLLVQLAVGAPIMLLLLFVVYGLFVSTLLLCGAGF